MSEKPTTDDELARMRLENTPAGGQIRMTAEEFRALVSQGKS